MATKNHGSEEPPVPLSCKTKQPDSGTHGNGQRGAALVVVLSLLLLISLITSTIVTISLSSAAQSSAFTEYEKSMLLAEGASARIYWLILNDRILHPNRDPGAIGAADKTNSKTSPEKTNSDKENDKPEFLADGTEHHISYYGYNVTFVISDMMSGFDVSGYSPENNLKDAKNLKKAKDGEQTENSAIEEVDPEFTIFQNRLMDYIDVDSLIRIDGMEKDEYKSLGLYNIPRNDKMQYREEVLFIPDAKKYFSTDEYGRLSTIKLIVPQRNAGQPQQLNIFAVDKAIIKNKIKCTEDELEMILKALESWKKDQTPLSDSLPLALITKLKQNFTFQESGFYNITIRASTNDNNQGRLLSVSMRIMQTITPEG
ncbi:MAG: hypothetical protein ACYC4Q_05495, partial [Victivallaceae bacterium]